jgi:hypothetical protein
MPLTHTLPVTEQEFPVQHGWPIAPQIGPLAWQMPLLQMLAGAEQAFPGQQDWPIWPQFGPGPRNPPKTISTDPPDVQASR